MNVEELRQVVSGIEIEPASREWNERQRVLVHNIMHDDPETFLRWDMIGETMFVSLGRYAEHEFSEIPLTPRWKRAIMEHPFGNPWIAEGDFYTSTNTVHSAYHFLVFERETGTNLGDYDAIFDFGGGYGCMARIARKLVFEGRYILFDLPVFSALQQFYLSGIAIDAEFETDWNKIDIPDNCLFVATLSMSEIPQPDRLRLYPHIEKCRGVLIAYQEYFGKYNNKALFEHLRASLPSFKWKNEQSRHNLGYWYLLGTRK